MRFHSKSLLMLFITICLLFAVEQAIQAAPVASPTDPPQVNRWVLSSGNTPTGFGPLTLSATFGQPILGTISNGAIHLKAGYWVGEVDIGSVIHLPYIQK